MSRPEIAIVQPAIDIDQLSRSIMKEHIALQDDERSADAHEKKTASFRESATRRRLEIGRLLVEAKARVKWGQWEVYVRKLGIDPRNSESWIEEYKHLDKSEPDNDGSDSPKSSTRRQRQAQRKASSPRYRKDEQPDPPEPSDDDDEDTSQSEPGLDVDQELYRLHRKIVAFAEKCPSSARQQIANELRQMANAIETIKG